MDKHIEQALRKAITNELAKLICQSIIDKYIADFAAQQREIERIRGEQQILLQQATRDIICES